MTLNELYDFAKNENIAIVDFSLNKREALSVMDSDGYCYIAIDLSRVASTADEKAKLAHEIGHCATGAFYNVFSPLDSRQKNENCAKKWAVKKLIPKDELNNAVSQGYTEIWELADFFNVTEDMIRQAISLYRYGNLYSV